GSSGKVVGVRKEVPFQVGGFRIEFREAGDVLERVMKRRVAPESLPLERGEYLGASQPFGDGHLVIVNLAPEEFLQHLRRGHRSLEEVLARLQVRRVPRELQVDSREGARTNHSPVLKQSEHLAGRLARYLQNEAWAWVPPVGDRRPEVVEDEPHHHRDPQEDSHKNEGGLPAGAAAPSPSPSGSARGRPLAQAGPPPSRRRSRYPCRMR